MIRTIRAELLKSFTTRMWWGLAIAVVATGLLFPGLTAFFLTSDAIAATPGAPQVDDAALARSVYTGGIQVAYLITLATGVMAIGSEYRHKTITSTFLATPHRARVMGAKVVALLGVGGFYGVLSIISSVAVGATVLSIKGHQPFSDSSIWRTLALSLLVLGLWALIGLGVGILIPNQVAALLIAIGVAWIVEPLLAFLLSMASWGADVARFFPSSASLATLEALSQSPNGTAVAALPWWGGALVLATYAAVMAIVGTILTLKRDVA